MTSDNHTQRTRTANGKPSIRVSNGRLQLRLRWQGVTRYLSLKMDNTPSEWKRAEKILRAVEIDIELDRFDIDNVESYLPKQLQRTKVVKSSQRITTLQELWIKYVENEDKNFGKTTKLSIINPLSNKIQGLKRCVIGKDEEKLIAAFSHLSIKTQNTQLARIKIAYRWGEKHGLIPEGSHKLIVVPHVEVEDVTPPDPLEDYEIQALFEECENRGNNDLLLLIKFLLYTGCRPSEAFGLRVSSVNLRKKELWFKETRNKIAGTIVEKEGTKTKRKRKFPINKQLEELIHQILDSRTDATSEYLLTYKGRPWNSNLLDQMWRGTQKGSKLHNNGIIPELVRLGRIERYRTPYNLRDTYISHCATSGIPTAVIAQWVGNSPRIIERHYFAVLDSTVSPTLYE